MKLLKSSIWSFLAVLIRGISALSVNKLFALYFGPSGIAFLSHFQNLINLFTTIQNDGINRGLIRYISPHNTSTTERQQYFSAALLLNIVVFIITLCITLFFDELFLEKFKTDYSLWRVLLFASMFILLIDYFLISMVLAFKKLVHIFLIELFGSITFFTVLYISVTFLSITIQQALVYYMIALSISFLGTSAIILSINKYKEVISFTKPKKIKLKGLNTFLIMAITAVLLQKGVDFYIREFSFTQFGTHDTGVWQGIVKISDYYLMAFTSVVMFAFYPQITSSLHNTRILKKTLFDGFKLYIPIIIMGCLFVYFTREFMIEILLDKEFLPGAHFIHWQIMGDFLKMTSMLLGLILLAQSKLKWFVIGELLSAATYIIAINIFQNQEITGLLKAHLIRYIIYLTYLLLYYRKILFQ